MLGVAQCRVPAWLWLGDRLAATFADLVCQKCERPAICAQARVTSSPRLSRAIGWMSNRCTIRGGKAITVTSA
jgi:hypothetical protein